MSATSQKLMFTAVALLAGCGSSDGLERAQIVGTVTISGQPLDYAVVQFLPAGAPGQGAIGQSDAQGKFTVTSSREDHSGLPPGDYTVLVSRMADPGGKVLGPDDTEADYPNARQTVPAPYSTAGTPLKVNVGKDGGDVKIDVPTALRDPKAKVIAKVKK
ncbi:hypothetical protein AYO47_08945 [Planctomyces sp. SCGC AG-212-M04]|nr:hypothetical protein AYO47_08945 [Planctomyces sp. SCGC AG-212-M04]